MTSTEANEQSAGKGCLTGGYFFTDSALAPARVLRSNYAFSAGAWATTGQDMIRYLKAIHLRNLPSDKGGFNWRKAPHQGDLPFTYEGGRFYSTFHGLDVISHNGGTPGFSSSWIYVPQKNTSIIVLMNRQDYAAVDQLAWELLSFFEPALEYPRRRRTGAAEQKMEQRVMAALTALRSGAPLPHGLARPLVHFLKSDQGSGYWKWYFERGFPAAVRCVDTEPIGKAKLYRFLLTFSEEVAYQFSVLENEKGELTQMRWW